MSRATFRREQREAIKNQTTRYTLTPAQLEALRKQAYEDGWKSAFVRLDKMEAGYKKWVQDHNIELFVGSMYLALVALSDLYGFGNKRLGAVADRMIEVNNEKGRFTSLDDMADYIQKKTATKTCEGLRILVEDEQGNHYPLSDVQGEVRYYED